MESSSKLSQGGRAPEELAVAHVELLDRCEALFDAVRAREPGGRVEEALGFLRRYLMLHLACEERGAGRDGFTGVEEHRRLHERTLRELELVQRQFDRDGQGEALVARTASLVFAWMSEHLGGRPAISAGPPLARSA